MNQRPMRSKSRVRRVNRLQLEQLEKRTVLATSSLMHDTVVAMPVASLENAVPARAPAFVAFMRTESSDDGRSHEIATVLFRPEVTELPELDTMKFELNTQESLFTDKYEVMSSVMRWQSMSYSGITIRFGEPAPIIRNPGREIDTPDFPTRSDNPSDPISTSPSHRPATFDSESWLISQALDLEDEMLYEQGTASTTWSEAYAQANTLLDPSAVDHIWSTVANNTTSSDDELPSEELEHEAIDDAVRGDELVSLDDIENLEVELRKAKEEASDRKSSIADQEDKSVTSKSRSAASERPDLSENSRAASIMIVPMYDEGGLADVATVTSDTRLVQSPVEAVLRRVTPDIASTGNVRDALGLLPKEWSADAADEATEGEDSPTLSTAYLGSFAVVVAAGLGVVLERKRRSSTPEDEIKQERKTRE